MIMLFIYQTELISYDVHFSPTDASVNQYMMQCTSLLGTWLYIVIQ